MAHGIGISCEDKIGLVGLDGGTESAGTDPYKAARFPLETAANAMATSVGNVPLQTASGEGLHKDRIRSIKLVTDMKLVIHGGSGVPMARRMAVAHRQVQLQQEPCVRFLEKRLGMPLMLIWTSLLRLIIKPPG